MFQVLSKSYNTIADTTKAYDKCDEFNFYSNVPASTAYGVFIEQLVYV